MVFSKNSTLKAFINKARKFGTSNLFGGFIDSDDKFIHPRDKVRIIYLSDNLNEPEDISFYSDRFASQCSKEVREEIEKETGHYIYHLLTWESKDNATKAIQCYCLSTKMMCEVIKLLSLL